MQDSQFAEMCNHLYTLRKDSSFGWQKKMEILGSWTYIGDVVAGMEVLDGGAKSIKSKQGVLSVKSSDLRQKSQRREPDNGHSWTGVARVEQAKQT
jgi:hypothetical protein